MTDYPCACDKPDWCGCKERFIVEGRLCSRCQMHQYRAHRTRIRKRGPVDR